MHRTLAWEPIDIGERILSLQQGIARYLSHLPENRIHDRGKADRWLGMLDYITSAIVAVRSGVIPTIEADIGYPLTHSDLVVLAMFQPSTRNLFVEIEVHFRGTGDCTLSTEELEQMAGLSDAAATLAWIGDAALKIGVLPEIWTPDIRKAGSLTIERQRYESNANMARLSDRWDLYRHCIRFGNEEPEVDRDHLKGTLVESVIGIIFLEGGLKRVGEAARLLRPREEAGSGT
jgi:dsRNA-specific ribonuclease